MLVGILLNLVGQVSGTQRPSPRPCCRGPLFCCTLTQQQCGLLNGWLGCLSFPDHWQLVGKPLGQPWVMKPIAAAGEWDRELSSPPRPPLPSSPRASKAGRRKHRQQPTGQPSREHAATPAPGGLAPATRGSGRGDHRRPRGQAPFPPLHGVYAFPKCTGSKNLWRVPGAKRLCDDSSSLLRKANSCHLGSP